MSSLNSNTLKYHNRLCGQCGFTDGMCYTSNPPKCKCTITGEYHYYNEACNVPDPISFSVNSNEIYADKEKDIKAGSITVKGFDSLVNALKILLDSHYKILIKKDGLNKYNESTLLTIEYYTKSEESDKNVQEAYHNYLVNKALTNPQHTESNKTLTDITAVTKINYENKTDDLSISGFITDNMVVMGSTGYDDIAP